MCMHIPFEEVDLSSGWWPLLLIENDMVTVLSLNFIATAVESGSTKSSLAEWICARFNLIIKCLQFFQFISCFQIC